MTMQARCVRYEFMTNLRCRASALSHLKFRVPSTPFRAPTLLLSSARTRSKPPWALFKSSGTRHGGAFTPRLRCDASLGRKLLNQCLRGGWHAIDRSAADAPPTDPSKNACPSPRSSTRRRAGDMVRIPRSAACSRQYLAQWVPFLHGRSDHVLTRFNRELLDRRIPGSGRPPGFGNRYTLSR